MNVGSDYDLHDVHLSLLVGETMQVWVEVINSSNRTVTPKFFLCEKQMFVAQSEAIVHTNEIPFGTGESVSARDSRTISNVLRIPPQLYPTFFNCSMIKLEYTLKVIVAELSLDMCGFFGGRLCCICGILSQHPDFICIAKCTKLFALIDLI